MSQTQPGVGNDEEEEKQEQQKGSGGRSAFFAGVHQADNFGGGYRGVPSAPHGGAAYVKPEDTIGTPDCWCGLTYGHTWPGKDKGAPHPRGDSMSTVTEETPRLSPRDLKAWDRKVVRALCALVNTYNVRYRIDRNQMHIYLFAPGDTDETITKFKAARSRDAEQTLRYLEIWASRYIRPIVTEEAVKQLAAKVNDPTKKPHSKPAVEPTTIKEAPVSAAPVQPAQIETSPASDGAPEGYHQHRVAKTGEPTNWWEADSGGKWLCKSCDYTVEGPTLQTRAAHQRMHSMTDERRSEVSGQAGATTDHEWQAKRTKARNAIRFLAEEYSIDIDPAKGGGRKVERAEARAERAEARLAAVTKELDDLKTKMALAKEAFGL